MAARHLDDRFNVATVGNALSGAIAGYFIGWAAAFLLRRHAGDGEGAVDGQRHVEGGALQEFGMPPTAKSGNLQKDYGVGAIGKGRNRSVSDTKTNVPDGAASGTPGTQTPAQPAPQETTQPVDQDVQKEAAEERADNGGYD